MNEQILPVLNAELPLSLQNTPLELQKQGLEGLAYAHLHRYEEAEKKLLPATQKCTATQCEVLGELIADQGFLEVERENYAQAQQLFEQVLKFAQQRHDPFLESRALLQISYAALQQEHFDESIDWSTKAYNTSRELGARPIVMNSQGNLGWAHYKIGDPESALDFFRASQTSAREIGATIDEVRWLTAGGYVYVDQGKFPVAEDAYNRALALASKINAKEEILNAQISLAFVNVLDGRLELARQYADQAIASARADGNRGDELYPLLTKAQVLVRTGDIDAEKTLSEIADDPKVDLSLKWEAQHELANLYTDRRDTGKAEVTYKAALTTFETARSTLQHEDVKLPFLANASDLYDDYVKLLIRQGRVNDALSVADQARARTLSEGLGQLKKSESVLPPALDAQHIARAAGGAILYYWLGQKQSYLWAITQQKTTLYTLPGAPQIDTLVKNYRKSLERPQAGIEAHNSDGTKLYSMLVEPAEQIIGKSSRVFIIPDGSLNALNFETLVVPGSKPHYWIEDVTITNASALRLLERSRSNSTPRRARLLLVGNPVTATAEFATPPQAATEMTKVGDHFPLTAQQVFSGAAATPVAYLASKPEQFGYIHFVAHGTASRLSPLDSAIVLSRTAPQDDSFRLYARDIIQKPLRADLVTISACYGAGTRAYSGEGLVGLSWAFLRAGAHNVIGALWDVSDASTPQLMDQMYLEIGRGKRPEEALRLAKLTLLHSNNSFHNPFYWAPFQIYSGS